VQLFPRILFLLIIFFLQSGPDVLAKEREDITKKYPSLLWEISHPDLEKKSYLYGTMHVSSKVAFHLGDSFFMALASADKVALESDPSTWLNFMLDSTYLDESGGLYRMGKYRRDFYRDAFEIAQTKRRMLQGAIIFNSGIVNGMLYRNSRSNADYEEDTYLDMYIYQAGKKWGKPIVGLEDFMESNRLVKKSRDIADDEDEEELQKAYKKLVRQGKNPSVLLEEAYRNGDLDMVDSLQFIMNSSKNHQKYMLQMRNRNMVDEMDSILNSSTSLFAGVGAAHLAGDSGMIEMLRDLGYTLRPVKRVINDVSRTRRNELEKTYVPQNFKTYKSSDGWFEVKLPNEFHELPDNQRYKLYFFPEMDNGTTYSLTRFRTYAALQGEDQSYAIERIDSVIYESIAGKIIKQDRIVRNGYPGYDIINKTRKGNYERLLILSTPLEFIVFKVSGTLDYLKDNGYLENVFSSFKITGSRFDWASYGQPWNNFKIDLPGTPLQENNPRSQLLMDNDCEFQALDEKDNYYRIKRAGLHDKFYIEEDTFELSYIATQFEEELNFEQSVRHYLRYKGFPAMRTKCSDSNSWIHSQYVIKGPHYFQLLVRSSDSTTPAQFFNSLEFKTPSYLFSYEECEDTLLEYCVQSPVKYVGWNAQKTPNRDQEEEDENKFAKDQRYRNFVILPSDERIFLSYERFAKYYYMPSYDSMWNSEIEYFTNFKQLALLDKTFSEDSTSIDLVLGDTNSSRIVRVKMITAGDRNYTLSFTGDTSSPMSPFAKRFFESFQYNDTSFGLAFYESKADLFFSDLQGSDSLVKLFALKSINDISFENRHVPQIIKLIDNYKHESFNIESKSALIEELGRLKHPSILPYLEKIYIRSVDTAQFQISVLTALARQKNKVASNMMSRLMDYETPLVASQDVEWMILELYDSLELATSLFPLLLDFTRYPEYKAPVLRLMSTMLDSGLIKPRSYRSYKKILLREAKDNLKRAMAIAQIGPDDYYYRSDESDLESNGRIMTYLNNILLPYSTDKNVDEYYQRAMRIPDDNFKMQTMVQLLKSKCSVNDTLWTHFASRRDTRAILFELLREINRLDKFPADLLNGPSIAEGLLYKGYEIEKKDSFHFYKKVRAMDKNGSGFIYIYKRKDVDETDKWKIDYIGIVPEDTTNYTFKSSAYRRSMPFYDDEELDKAIETVVENLLFEHRQRVVKKNSPYNRYSRY